MRRFGMFLALGISQAHSQGVPPLVWQIQAHQNNTRVQDISFSPDGRFLATAGEDKTIKIWTSENGQLVASATTPKAVGCVAWSPDGTLLASSSFVHEGLDQGDHVVRIWNPTNMTPITTLPGSSADVQHVEFSHDGSMLASCTRDGSVLLYSTSTWLVLASRKLGTWSVMDIKFLPSDDSLVALDFGGDFTVLTVPDLNISSYIPTNMSSAFCSLALTQDGKTIAGIAFNLMSWVSLQNYQVSSYTTSQISQCYGADRTQDNRYFVFAGLGGAQEIEVWDIANRRLVQKWDCQSDNRFQIAFSIACQPGRSDWFAFGNFYGELRMARNPWVKYPRKL